MIFHQYYNLRNNNFIILKNEPISDESNDDEYEL